MMKWKTLGALLFAAVLALQWQQGHLHWARDPASLSGNTCEGKRTCAVIYYAPWCPHCRADITHAQALLSRSRSGDTGVKIVVGLEKRPGTSEAFARSIASKGVTIDSDQKLARELGVQSVPSYVVLDQEGTKLVEGPDAYQWVMEKFGR